MPATYAHYRFGSEMLQAMPADISRTAKRYRRLYDVGLHGPDLFFYYKPLVSTKIGDLGYRFHRQSGKEFFSRVCRGLRLEPSEPAQAYLYGVLCHYALDSVCHPFVDENSGDGQPSHTRIETEFDRWLMERDGKAQPYRESLTKHMQLTAQECQVAARFYPGAEPKHIREGLRGMVTVRKLLTMPEGKVQDAVKKIAGTASQLFADMLPGSEADPLCAALDAPLMERYRQASGRFPELLVQLGAHLTYNAPLGEDFSSTFGGC